MEPDVEYDQRLRNRLVLLRRKFETGTISIPPDAKLTESILAVRYGPDGEIDLSTADGTVRSLALAVEAMEIRSETKAQISLPELQAGYFGMMERAFGSLYQQMIGDGATPNQVARWVSADPEGVRRFGSFIPEFLEWLDGLWESAHSVAEYHAQDINGLKAIFGGEIFPIQQSNIASSTGVYVDTIVLPDPFLRSRMFLEGSDRSEAVSWFLKGGLSLLKYKELALAQFDTPIVAVIPDIVHFDEYHRKYVFDIADQDTLLHLNMMFEREFKSIADAEDFLGRLKEPADLVAALSKKDLLLFEEGDKSPLEDQIADYLEMIPEGRKPEATGMVALLSTVGRMRQATDLIVRSQRLGGTPLIDAPTSWRYFNWKLSHAAKKLDARDGVALHVTKGLQSLAAGEMSWLGKVPADALIEMRRAGALPELRQILSAGVAELLNTNSGNFYRTGDKVMDNIRSAFDDHRKRLDQLRGKKWRFAGIELGACTVHGAIAIAAACGVPFVSLVNTALDQVGDVPKAKELPKKFRQLRQESRELNSSPVGLLFKQQNN